MPRQYGVDYPQIPHRTQPHLQTQLGLAPPPFFSEQDRYSWQVTPVEVLPPKAEEQFEALNNRRRQQKPETPQTRRSAIPPLPILPHHLAQDRKRESTSSMLPSQKRDLALTQAQQGVAELTQDQNATVPPQPQLQITTSEQALTPSFENSLHQQQQQQYQRPRTVEQLTMGVLPIRNPQQYTYIPPNMNGRHLSPLAEVPSPEHEKLSSFTGSTKSPSQSQLSPIQIGPDENPLSSPGTVNIPVTARTVTRQMPIAPEMHFPRSSHFAPTQPSQGGSWQYSLASCADPATCLSSLFCPCFVYGRTQHRLSLKSSGKDSTNMLGFSSINGSCLAWSVLPGINVLLTAIQHRRIRKAYKMDGQAGNFVGDCVKGVCCCCCMLAQAEKEMKVREVSVAKKIDGYKSPVDMVFAQTR